MIPSVPTGTLDEYFGFSMKEETFVFIDAGYLSKISKHFGQGRYIRLDYNQFANTLARDNYLWCKGVFFYTAPPFQSDPPTPREERMKRGYDKFVNKIRKIPNFTLREGRLQKIDGDYRQKGVDTLITMDLFKVCYNEDINKIILLACDTDFVPILKELRRSRVKVILYYYSDYIRNSNFSMSNHILTACDESKLLTIEHFNKSLLKSKK